MKLRSGRPVSLVPVELAAADEGWDDLAAAAGNPFATAEWVRAWWRHYGSGRTLTIWRVLDDDGRLVALLPLVRLERGPLALVRFAGHGAADQLGPVCAPGDATLAAAGLREIAGRLRGAGLLLADRVPVEDGYAASLGGSVLRHHASPVLEIASDWDGWLAEKSSNFRAQVRRLERRLARDHRLRFRLADDPERLDEDLELLFALHEARWHDGGSTAFSPTRRAFHRDFARAAQARGWLRLWFAEVDGRPAAAWYGIRHAGRDWYYQMGRDPAFDKLKVGWVLLTHTIRDAFESGARAYHFGLGPEPYKDRFATKDPGVETIVLGSRAATSVSLGAYRALQRFPQAPRRAIATRAE